jgi:hypothetical protein
MKKFVHSYWAQPSLQNGHMECSEAHFANLYLFALSYEYIRKNGFEIMLFADVEGYKALEFMPYFNNIILPKSKFDGIDTCFFAASKILALRYLSAGSVHIDNDVFLKSPKLCERILKFNSNVIFQNFEFIINVEGAIDTYGLFHKKIKEEINLFDLPKFACNTGILGFNNETFKYKFCESYLYYAKKISMLNFDFTHMTGLDILIEQAYLGKMLEDNNFSSYSTVLNGVNTWSPELRDQAKQIGYTHLLGSSKYRLLPEVKERLKKLNFDLYNKAVKQEYLLRKELKK